MKYIRITVTPDSERAPELFHLLAGASSVTETRLYDWNLSHEEGATALFEVDGDIDRFRDEVGDVPGIRSADATRVTAGQFTLLLVLEPAAVPLLKGILGAITQEGLVVAKPIVYRDGQVHGRIVGNASVLQKAIDDLPSELSIEISSVGDFNRSRTTPLSRLSDRQRAALLAAFDLGYYEFPRQATHEDVAARLGCASHTATEHLQKAEIKVITDVLKLEFER